MLIPTERGSKGGLREIYVVESLDPTTGEPRTANLEAKSKKAWRRADIKDKQLITHAAVYTTH